MKNEIMAKIVTYIKTKNILDRTSEKTDYRKLANKVLRYTTFNDNETAFIASNKEAFIADIIKMSR